MLPLELFERFQQAITDLPLKGADEKYEKPELICPRFRLFSESGLDVYTFLFISLMQRPAWY